MALLLLKEVRLLFHTLGTTRDDELPVLDVINKACPAVLEKCLPYLPYTGKGGSLALIAVDLFSKIEPPHVSKNP